MTVSFNKQLNNHWAKIAKIVRDLSHKRAASAALSQFVDFIVAINTPLSTLVAPLVHQKVSSCS